MVPESALTKLVGKVSSLHVEAGQVGEVAEIYEQIGKYADGLGHAKRFLRALGQNGTASHPILTSSTTAEP